MRNLVDPPPSLRCQLCGSELRFKRIEPDSPVFDTQVEIFVCVKCGRAHPSRMIELNRYGGRGLTGLAR